jgi:hypothetical protein
MRHNQAGGTEELHINWLNAATMALVVEPDDSCQRIRSLPSAGIGRPDLTPGIKENNKPTEEPSERQPERL